MTTQRKLERTPTAAPRFDILLLVSLLLVISIVAPAGLSAAI